MNEYIIRKLKEGRNNAGLKQSEVAKKIGIKGNTLSNYENGVTEPDIDTFCALCDIYSLDPSEILGEAYGLSVQGGAFNIKPSEIERIKKYRTLDEHGKDMVDMVLEKESERMDQLQQAAAPAPAADAPITFPDHLTVNAAHADENSTAEDRQADDDMMMDDSEWE